MRYEWDEARSLRNQRRHEGISFKVAALVFEDEHCLVLPDRIDRRTGEQRWHALGAVSVGGGAQAVLVVIHVYREDHEGERSEERRVGKECRL